MIRAHERNEGGSPANSCCAGTLTAGAYRPWNTCLFTEGFVFTFNRAVNCLSGLRSGRPQAQQHRLRQSTRTISHLRVHPRQKMGYRNQKRNATLGGLLSGKPNLKQEPSQTTLSHSRLHCVSIFPQGTWDLWSREGSTACRMEQIVHGSNFSLWHEGVGGQKRELRQSYVG